jgi:3-hydroxyacyl-CoA dehydrogenase
MTVHLKQHGTVVVVTIDNPPVNAMNLAVRQELLASVQRLDGDPSVTAVVLAGAGRAFVGGADIAEFDRPVEEPSLPVVIAAIEAARKPWVAAVQGVALGGGLELVLGCHYRLAGPQASFALPEVTLGIIPGAGGTQRLPRLIGVAAAIGVVAENQTLNAQRAAQLGLVARVFDGDLLADAVAFARSIAAMPLPLTAGRRRSVAGR